MRYMVYGVDAASQAPRQPVAVEADSEEEARGRAVARGMAVRAVIAEPAPARSEESAVKEMARPQQDGRPTESDEMRGVRRTVAMVLLPLALAFFLAIAAVRTAVQAATWTLVWGMGVLLGGGLAGLLGWFSHGAVSVHVAWPPGLATGLVVLSAAHGWRAGWRWWWARRMLDPLAQALGVVPEEGGVEESTGLRAWVVLAQALAGGLLATSLALVGGATEWGWPIFFAGTLGGALGLGLEGATLGAALARLRPMRSPGAVTGPSIESLAGLLARLWGKKHFARSWMVGYALDRAAPGAVAGTFVGMLVFVLARLALGG